MSELVGAQKFSLRLPWNSPFRYLGTGRSLGPTMWTELIEPLRVNQVGIIDGWLPETTLGGLRAEILGRQKIFAAAGIGRGSSFQVNPTVRSDRLCWMDPQSLTSPQAALFAALDTLRVALNRSLFLGLRRFEGHLTIYPPGASYQKHLDQHRNHRHRVVSFVLYLNRYWSPGRGGELRLFDHLAHEMPVQDVPPLWGRMVVFFSDSVPHQVLPTRQHRLSATGWFRDDD